MKKNTLLLIASLFLFCNCSNKSNSEIYQSDRDNVLEVKDKIHEIVIDEPMIGSISRLYLVNDYFVIIDVKSYDDLIKVFDKKDFKYLTSTTPVGGGPGEISNIGFLGVNSIKNEFYVSDHGKQKIFNYNMDSVLTNPSYLPTVKVEMNGTLFPNAYEYISDTLSIGLMIKPNKEGNSFSQSVARWNMLTGEMIPIKYEHPKIVKRRFAFAASKEHNLYVEAHSYSDLLTICDLQGNLVANVYGPDWNEKQSNKTAYYDKAIFCKDKIIVSYIGGDSFIKDKNGSPRSAFPTKFQVFDLKGNYVKTLDVGYNIQDFCYDEELNRLIMSFDDDIQFAYLDLKGLI